MVKFVAGRPPLELVVTRPVTEIPVHETGTLWLIGEPRATVGCLESLLHSRIAPVAPLSKPDPVTLTTVPPFRHVPGFAVRLGGPVDVEAFAEHGTVVVVLLLPVVVVVVVLDVVVVVVDAVVVVVVGGGVVPLKPRITVGGVPV
jgi:hypothetical protein